ncbi:MAG: hypothetical protein ACI9V1_001793 [Spirosomataceae bacterium]|jgi:hypothetical protein
MLIRFSKKKMFHQGKRNTNALQDKTPFSAAIKFALSETDGKGRNILKKTKY